MLSIVHEFGNPCGVGADDRPMKRHGLHNHNRQTLRKAWQDQGPRLKDPSANFFVNSNYWYAHDADPLFMHPPDWMRIVTGLSAFVYMPFYLVLTYALVTGRNWIQLPSVIYATMIATLTGIVVFGVEFWGEAALRTHNPVKFLAFNLPYVLVPLILLVRMRKPLPFARKF